AVLNTRMSGRGGSQAARVLSTVRGEFASEAERDAFEAPILETYEREGSPYFATARLWDDGIIDPLDTRRAVARRAQRPARHTPCAGLRPLSRAPRPDPRHEVRRVPDVAASTLSHV